jgi:hypothetical protein
LSFKAITPCAFWATIVPLKSSSGPIVLWT